jgi:hypothetical protein
MDPIFHNPLARTTPDAPVSSQASYLIKIQDTSSSGTPDLQEKLPVNLLRP